MKSPPGLSWMTSIPRTSLYHGRETLGSLMRNMVWLNMYVEGSDLADGAGAVDIFATLLGLSALLLLSMREVRRMVESIDDLRRSSKEPGSLSGGLAL